MALICESIMTRLPLLLLCSTIACAQVNTLGLVKDREKGLSGNLGFNFDAANGNSTYLKYGANGRVDLSGEKTLHFLVADYQIGQSGTHYDTYLRKGFAHARSIWRIKSWMAPELFVQAEINDGLRLKYRDLAGIGFRIGPLHFKSETQDLALALGTGLMYEIEDYQAQKIPGLPQYYFERIRNSSYMSLEYSRQGSLSFNWGSYFQPLIDEPSSYRILSNAKLSLPLISKLRIFGKWNLRYDSKPLSPSIRPWDFDQSQGLEWNF